MSQYLNIILIIVIKKSNIFTFILMFNKLDYFRQHVEEQKQAKGLLFPISDSCNEEVDCPPCSSQQEKKMKKE